MPKLPVTDSCGNVFRDLGLPCADEKQEVVRLRVLLGKIAVHADEGQGGSDSYKLDRLVQIEKLAKLATR